MRKSLKKKELRNSYDSWNHTGTTIISLQYYIRRNHQIHYIFQQNSSPRYSKTKLHLMVDWNVKWKNFHVKFTTRNLLWIGCRLIPLIVWMTSSSKLLMASSPSMFLSLLIRNNRHQESRAGLHLMTRIVPLLLALLHCSCSCYYWQQQLLVLYY